MKYNDFFYNLKNHTFENYQHMLTMLNNSDKESNLSYEKSTIEKLSCLQQQFNQYKPPYHTAINANVVDDSLRFFTEWTKWLFDTAPVFFPIDLSDGAGSFLCFDDITQALLKNIPHFSYQTYPTPGISQTTIAHLNHWAHGKGFNIQKLNEDAWCLYAGGTTRACAEIFSLNSPTDIVLIPTPTYGNLIPVASKFSQVELLPLTAATAWRLTPALLTEAIQKINNKYKQQNFTVKMLLFVNPANPTGVVYTQKEINALAEILLKNNCLILEDSIHHDLELGDDIQQGFFQASSAADQTITVFGPSKTYGAAGWRLGISFTHHPEYARKLKNNQQLQEFSMNPLYEVIAESCYNSSLSNQLYLEGNKVEYRLRHELLKLFVKGEQHAAQIKNGKLLVQYIQHVFPEKAESFLQPCKDINLLTEPQASFFQLLGFKGWKNKYFGKFQLKNSWDIYQLLCVLGILTIPDITQGHYDFSQLSVRVSISNSLFSCLNFKENRIKAQNIIAHYALGCAIERIKWASEKLVAQAHETCNP